MCRIKRMIGIGVVGLSLSLNAEAIVTYVVDGFLDDWGVVPFSQWTPTRPTADWLTEDYWGGLNNLYKPSYYGGELFDSEAIYFDDDPLFSYFALITSFPSAGVPDPYGRAITYRTGDIALDLNGDGDYEYGIKTTGADTGLVSFNPLWSLPHKNYGFPQDFPSEFTNGTTLGYTQIAYRDIGDKEGNGTSTYVIEGMVSRDWLGNPAGDTNLKLHWVMSCGNDALDLPADFDSPPVPEPVTGLLFLCGVMVWGLWRKRG